MENEVKAVDADGYGLCIYSMEVFQNYLKREKIRAKKLLHYFQKDKEKYIQLQKEGIWIPIVQIDSYKYNIKIANLGETFDEEEWEKKLDYEGFNIEVKDGVWVSGISSFYKFAPNEFTGDGTTREYRALGFNVIEYFSNKERWCGDKDTGSKTYSDIWYDVPAGKYLLTIRGYAKKEIVNDREIKYGYQLEFKEVDEFHGYKNPRESDDYEFNIGTYCRNQK